jgi:transposase
MVKAYQSGLTQRQVADLFGLHVQTVRRHLTRAGVKSRTRRTVLTEEQLDQAAVERRAGTSTRKLGEMFGVAHTTIARLVREHEERLDHCSAAMSSQEQQSGPLLDIGAFLRAMDCASPMIAELARYQRAIANGSYDPRDFPSLVSTDSDFTRDSGRGPTRAKRTEGENRALALRARALRDEGWSLRRIGEDLGISHSTVHGLLAGRQFQAGNPSATKVDTDGAKG